MINQKRIKQLKVTKGTYKTLPNNSNLRVNKKFYSLIKLKRFSFFILKYKQLLNKYYGDTKLRFSSIKHKQSFKNKNRLYLSNYLCYLELKLSGILYNSFLMPKIKLLKQYILHKFITVNNKSIQSYNFKIHPYDIIGVSTSNQHSYLLTNKLLKKPMIFKFSLLKELSIMSLFLKRLKSINIHGLKILLNLNKKHSRGEYSTYVYVVVSFLSNYKKTN